MIRSTTWLLAALVAPAVYAQEGSLLFAPAAPPPAGVAPTLANSSFLYQTLPPEATPQPIERETIVTVLVDYRSVMLSEGSGETIKIGVFNAVLSDWIKFDGQDIFPSLQSRGDPAIAGNLNSQSRAESDIEQRESLTFPIACKVVDIRPNNNLVLEGRREVRVNEEVWFTYVTGTVARQQIGPDGVVRSDAIADLRVWKEEHGAVRDGYARGWLTRWYGKYKAF